MQIIVAYWRRIDAFAFRIEVATGDRTKKENVDGLVDEKKNFFFPFLFKLMWNKKNTNVNCVMPRKSFIFFFS